MHVAIVLMFLGFAGEASSRMSRCCSSLDSRHSW